MKRGCLLILGVLLTSMGWSQTMNVHYKNGQTVEYNMDNIDYVEFTEIKQNDAQVSSGKAIDLGLSVKWASCNVGATSPEEFGDRFAWGETETKTKFKLSNYLYYDSYTQSYIDIGLDIKGTKYDVAHVKWGGGWRMPTYKELKELYDKCDWKWSRFNDVNGYIVTGPNGNSIFSPVGSETIHLWASTLSISDKNLGVVSGWGGAIFFSNSSHNYMNSGRQREYGCYVRPVMPL